MGRFFLDHTTPNTNIDGTFGPLDGALGPSLGWAHTTSSSTMGSDTLGRWVILWMLLGGNERYERHCTPHIAILGWKDFELE